MSAISRPRLSERALPRLSFADGRCRVLIHDGETGGALAVDPREWVLLAGADGTRDLEGVLLAAAREGVIASRDDLARLLSVVRDRGLLAEGLPVQRQREPQQTVAAAQGDHSIERLPGYSFHCDGSGTCCKLYPTVVFTRMEAARARVLLPRVLDGGDRHEHVFTPERGAGPCAGSAVALVDGRCAYLDGDRCGLHREGGAGAKPVGCNTFPLSLVDDGVRVRASMLVECACVLASAGRNDGEPIVAEPMRLRSQLDPALVEDLPQTVEVRSGVSRPLIDYRAWSDAALAALPSSEDAARAAWSLADALASHGLDETAARAAIEAPSQPDASLVATYLSALADAASRRAAEQNDSLGARDLRRRSVNALAAAVSLLADADLLAAVIAGAGAAPRDEAFYLRAVLFGHQLARAPLVAGLHDRAVAIWVARVFPLAVEALYPGEDAPTFAHPLAVVEALLRGHGLRRYVERIELP